MPPTRSQGGIWGWKPNNNEVIVSSGYAWDTRRRLTEDFLARESLEKKVYTEKNCLLRLSPLKFRERRKQKWLLQHSAVVVFLTRGVGEAEGGNARARFYEEPIGMSVVAAVELYNLFASGERSHQPKHAHAGLGRAR